MKTDCFEVRSIHSREAMDLVMKYHYSQRVVSARFCFGLFIDHSLIGCVVYSQPASYTLCKGVCGEDYKNSVLELSRLVITTSKKNAASVLIGRSMQHLKKIYYTSQKEDQFRGVVLVSYADCNEHVGHVGYVYQATNWIYTGQGSAEPIWINPKTSEVISYTRRHIDQKAKLLGLDWRELEKKPQIGKHRYVNFAGTRTFISRAKTSLKYKQLPYPKGNTTRHEPSHKASERLLF